MDARNRYAKNHYDRFSFNLPKGSKEQLMKIAEAKGMSLTKYIALCVEQQSGIKVSLDNELEWIKKKSK